MKEYSLGKVKFPSNSLLSLLIDRAVFRHLDDGERIAFEPRLREDIESHEFKPFDRRLVCHR